MHNEWVRGRTLVDKWMDEKLMLVDKSSASSLTVEQFMVVLDPFSTARIYFGKIGGPISPLRGI